MEFSAGVALARRLDCKGAKDETTMAFLDRSLLFVASLGLVATTATGCATAGVGDGSAAGAPIVSVQLFPSDHLDEEGDVPLPEIVECEDERIDVALADGDDDRCAQDIVAAAATSYLFVRQASGESMSVATYESDRAIEDALDEAEFQRIVRRADAAPRDGIIVRSEALEVERRVAALVEGR